MDTHLKQNDRSDEKKGHGVNIRSSFSLILISVIYFTFVDDNDLPMSASTRTTTGEDLQPLFQAEIDC